METSIFVQLSLVIVVGAAVSLLMRLLRQPLIMGYILTGIVVGPSFLHLIRSKDAFESFSEIGIALLLFIIGLELNTAVIRRMGKVVAVVSTIQIIGTGAIGYMVAMALGYGGTEALIIATALTFSSTIIIIKIINDKKEHNRLYAQIAIGILLVQDIVATLALILLATGAQHSVDAISLLSLGIKGVVLTALLALASMKLLPAYSRLVAGSQEFLFLFALAWGFGIASLFEVSGFSVEVGALFAGVSLASLPYAQEVGARLKPLRDFFVVVFFIALGESIRLDSMAAAIVPALVLAAVVIVVKPVLVFFAMGAMGYTKRASFKTAFTLGQVSEFSIVFVVLAVSSGVVGPELQAAITLLALITIAISTYMMKYDDKLFARIEDRLRLFERRVVSEESRSRVSYPLMLFGYQKGGHEFVSTFRQIRKKFVIIDYDPEVIEQLEHRGLPFVYGDATDIELLEEIGIDRAKLIVSTMTDFATNSSLLQHVRRHNPKAVFISHADTYEEAAELYRYGATYVMMPHLIGSERISAFIKRHGVDHEAFDSYREKHLLGLGRAAIEHGESQ